MYKRQAFDPRVMWEKEKERVAEQAAEAKADCRPELSLLCY